MHHRLILPELRGWPRVPRSDAAVSAAALWMVWLERFGVLAAECVGILLF